MSLFKVIKEKCGGDGACAAVCPIKIIEMDKETHLPKLVEGGEKACINCGHCMAVCRTGALELASMPLEACTPRNEDWRVPPDKLEHFLKNRRSIRAYKDAPVDRKLIDRLIDTARYAPTGINRQPVCWAVVYETPKIKQLSKLVVDWMKWLIKEGSPIAESIRMENIIKMYENGSDPILRGAPHVIITYALKDDMTAPQSCTIALTYLDIMAASLGLGTCWAGYVQMAINMSPDVRKFVGLSPKTNSFGAMMIGYSKYNYWRIPLRNDPHVIWR